jgi:LAO/AO transport system kinase
MPIAAGGGYGEGLDSFTLRLKNPTLFHDLRLRCQNSMSAKDQLLDGKSLFSRAVMRDFMAFAKLLTWIERSRPEDVLALPELLNPSRRALRLGITGPPGAGKSTLVGQLLKRLSKQKLNIGVLAVDPSSPFSRGAILGDRIRYSDHFLDPNIFIRSLGTRGSLGGLSSAAFLMARAFDACGFDLLLIETVGVGQTELDILHVADHVCVVLVPESGDSIQAMKAGLMEIADLFVVNKSDRPGADNLVREIRDGLSEQPVEVIQSVALDGTGVDELASWCLQAAKKPVSPKRLQEEAKALLRRQWEAQIEVQLASVQDAESLLAVLNRPQR